MRRENGFRVSLARDMEMTVRTKTRFGFLAYVSRSGSTLVGDLLSRYESVCVCVEANLPKELFGLGPYESPVFGSADEVITYLRDVSSYSKLPSWELRYEDVVDQVRGLLPGLSGRDLVRGLMEAYRLKHAPDSTVCIYKGSPAMPWDGRELLAAFPDFRVIHLIRDPRAVYASQKRSINPYTGAPFSATPLDTVEQWYRAVHQSGRIRSDRWLDVRFEDVLSSTGDAMEQLLEFLDVDDWAQSNSGGLVKRLPDEERELHSLVSKDPDRGRAESWPSEITAGERRTIEAVVGTYIRRLHYPAVADAGLLHKPMVFCAWRLKRFGRLARRAGRLLLRVVRGDRRYWGKVRSMIRGLVARLKRRRDPV